MCAPLATALRFRYGGYANRGLRPQWTSPPAIIHPHLRRSFWLFCAGRTWGIAALESSVGAKDHSRGCNPRYWRTPTQQNRGAVASNIPLRCFYLSWNFAIRRSFWLFFVGETRGCRDVACNVSLSIMVFLPPDHVIFGMEYGDVARYVSTCHGILFSVQ